MSAREQILVVSSDEAVHAAVREALAGSGWRVAHAFDGEEGLGRISRAVPDLVVVDAALPRSGGVAWLEGVRERGVAIDALVLSEALDSALCLRAEDAGAWEVLLSPPGAEDLARAVAWVFETRRAREGAIPFERYSGDARLVGRSAPMQGILRQIAKASRGATTVLILGETGTGKGEIAKEIHALSRGDRPFRTANLGGLDATLAASELFGHVKGAYTGAEGARRGVLQQAGSGTAFLDEVGDTDLDIQTKLLSVLQDRCFTPLGGDESINLDARLITATNRDLEALVEGRLFRGDLYHRIAVLVIRVPPLRDRREDLTALVPFLLTRAMRDAERPGPLPRVSRRAWQAMQEYSWPGNVRELANVLARGVANHRGGVIRLQDLALGQGAARAPGSDTDRKRQHGFTNEEGHFMTSAEVETAHLGEALRLARGVVADAARRLGIPRTSMYDRMRRLGMG